MIDPALAGKPQRDRHGNLPRHRIVPGTRLYCVGWGEGDEAHPCPARAWWHHDGKPHRPRKRCDTCWRFHRRDKSKRDHEYAREVLGEG